MDLRFRKDKNPSQQGGTAESRCGNRSRELRATDSTLDTQELERVRETVKSQSWP